MTRELAKAFNAGADAFDNSAGGCPYGEGTLEAQAWWQGWQTAAEIFILAEFERAKGDD